MAYLERQGARLFYDRQGEGAPPLVIQSTNLTPQQIRVPLQPGDTPWLGLVWRAVPAAQIEIVGGAGHFTMLDKPQLVNQLIDGFVAGVAW